MVRAFRDRHLRTRHRLVLASTLAVVILAASTASNVATAPAAPAQSPEETPSSQEPARTPPAAPALPTVATTTTKASAANDAALALEPARAFVTTHCATCHNDRMKAGGLALDALDLGDVSAHAPEWEKVIVKLRAGLMPPAGVKRPASAVIDQFTTFLADALDTAAAAAPNPGRTETLHRLNRAEYRNAIRDLLGLDIDTTSQLPADEISYGFDNIAGVLKLSPLLTERYLAMAQKVARLALGTPAPPAGDMYRIPDEVNQDVRVDGMPAGTRGGTRVDYFAPRDGEYVVKTKIGRGVDYDVPHFLGDQDLEISVDGRRVQVFTLPATPGMPLNLERQVPQPVADAGGDGRRRPALQTARDFDSNWEVRVPLTAGPHEIRATFLAKTNALAEGFRRPYLKPYIGTGVNDQRETREGASLRELEILGPLNPGAATESPSYRRVFTCRPAIAAEEAACARTILSTIARRAYRRPVTAEDLALLTKLYDDGRSRGSFDAGIELALQGILMNPAFLFRIAEEPPAVAARGGVYRIGGIELASRLSFFLWSSIPDDELLDLAIAGRLHEPAVLERQTRRMLADPRSRALTANFAGQWLELRKLKSVVPDSYQFPDYGPSMAADFQKEVELFFESILREDRPVIDLLTANYTYVNELLARHYGIPNVRGGHFRRVTLDADSPRRGLLGKGAILAATALPNRTSPVVRGKWVLQNLLGTPPPEPPPDVPSLQENDGRVTKVKTLRQRLELHRANPVCASCHNLMDPIGFALESFDVVGRYRTYDENFEPIDNSGVYPDGTRIDGLAGLRGVLTSRSYPFVTKVTSALLTYALGRGLEHYDQPAVRAIVRGAAPRNYPLTDIILGIVTSTPFQMRRSDS